MEVESLQTLVQNINSSKIEPQNVAIKSCYLSFPNKIFDTLSSFSNQDEGGTIIFGLGESPEHEIEGVYDSEAVTKKIIENCNQMSPKVNALITVCEIKDKMVVAAEIPGVEAAQRPVFYSGAGKLKGSYLRINNTDQPMSEYELYSYEAFRKRIHDDLRVVERARVDMFDPKLLKEYLAQAREQRRSLSSNVKDDDILELTGVTYMGEPTLAGALVFSRYPQMYFPQLCITAVVVPGTQMGDVGPDGERFIDNKKITGSAIDMLEEAVDFVRRNSRTKTIIGDDGLRHDKYEYPMRAVREAILNSLVHRDYSILTENTPISIEMYRDRLEIRSCGGLYGTNAIKDLGKTRPETRNAALANILELLKITENRYSGIPTIYRELETAGLPKPEFDIRRGEFVVTFRNNIYESEKPVDKSDMSAAILEFCKKPRSRQEIVDFTGKSRYYTMSSWVQPLVEEGKLSLSMPDKPKSSNQMYTTVSAE